MRTNPELDLDSVLQELAVGEALISMLDEQGVPSVTQRALIVPPASRIGPLTEAERKQVIASSPIGGRYEQRIERESAYEKLSEQQPEAAAPKSRAKQAEADEERTGSDVLQDVLFGSTGPRGGKREGLVETLAKSAARTMGSSLARGLLGSLLGGGTSKKRRR
jgi:DNA helicase HerA-like ATPase